MANRIGDPAESQKWVKPKIKRPVRRKAMPANMVAAADKAIARHKRRPAVAPIEVLSEGDHWELDCPFREIDRSRWEALLFEAFGTRSYALMNVFTRQLAELVDANWREKRRGWLPSGIDIVAAVQMVAGCKVQNEPQAALAAQMVAVHLGIMKLMSSGRGRSYMDERTAATLSRLARTYAMQLDTLNRVQGKGRSSRQKIVVKHEKHVHQHQHVHFEGGAPDFGGQAHATQENSGVEKFKRARESEECAALPGPHPSGSVMQIGGCEGQTGVPDARRRARIRSAEG